MTCFAVCAPIRPRKSSVTVTSSSDSTFISTPSPSAVSTSSSTCWNMRISPVSASISARKPTKSSSASGCSCFQAVL